MTSSEGKRRRHFVMVIGGLLLVFVQGVPNITLNPDFVFLVVLPPLLYAAAWNTSWRDFRYNFVSIFLLAFGLVAFAVVSVAPKFQNGRDGHDGREIPSLVQGFEQLIPKDPGPALLIRDAPERGTRSAVRFVRRHRPILSADYQLIVG